MAENLPVTDLYPAFKKENADPVVDPYRPLYIKRRESLALLRT
jgi:hypothetical protein